MIIEQILDVARWAPSGDNTQPWRFEIISERHLAVHGFDTRRDCVYDFLGHGSQIALGTLLENISIASSGHGMISEILYRRDSTDEHPVFDVRFTTDSDIQPSHLIPFILDRCVQRRPYTTQPLGAKEKNALLQSVGANFEVSWVENLSGKIKMARLTSASGKLRLSIPEAYEVHKKIIHWDTNLSEDRVPDQAIGLDEFSLHLMKWVMGSWERVEFFNLFLAGTLLPRIQLDIMPALGCAAHFFLFAEKKPVTLMDYVAAGRAVQRFWLTATMLGLQLQPEMSPLIFRNYAANSIHFSKRHGSDNAAKKIANTLDCLAGSTDNGDRMIFMGRIGFGEKPKARSIRLPMEQLLMTERSHDPKNKKVSTRSNQ